MTQKGREEVSDEPTADIAPKYETKPTLDTILERLAEMRDEMRRGFATVHERLEQLEIRMDRTQAMVYDMRADFKEFRQHFKEPV